jgi:hypothetical protein
MSSPSNDKFANVLCEHGVGDDGARDVVVEETACGAASHRCDQALLARPHNRPDDCRVIRCPGHLKTVTLVLILLTARRAPTLTQN